MNSSLFKLIFKLIFELFSRDFFSFFFLKTVSYFWKIGTAGEFCSDRGPAARRREREEKEASGCAEKEEGKRLVGGRKEEKRLDRNFWRLERKAFSSFLGGGVGGVRHSVGKKERRRMGSVF